MAYARTGGTEAYARTGGTEAFARTGGTEAYARIGGTEAYVPEVRIVSPYWYIVVITSAIPSYTTFVINSPPQRTHNFLPGVGVCWVHGMTALVRGLSAQTRSPVGMYKIGLGVLCARPIATVEATHRSQRDRREVTMLEQCLSYVSLSSVRQCLLVSFFVSERRCGRVGRRECDARSVGYTVI